MIFIILVFINNTIGAGLLLSGDKKNNLVLIFYRYLVAG